jgi:ubiquinone/menaquinone biosynthesis C-methylase UbiE
LRKASNILEVACGTGKLLPYALEVKNPNAHYLASDLSPNMVHLAKENLKAHFQKYQSRLTFEEWCSAQKIQFEVINAEEPFQHELFDRIICNCALMIT